VLTYALLGAMFGYLGGVATFDNTSNGVLLLIAGSFMILAGFSLIGKISFLNSIEHSISSTKWYQELFRDQLQKESKISFFILGMLNGLLPCGFVYFFAITAASTADPLWGALVMIVFGLSTIPAMFSLGFFVGVLKKTEFRGILIKVASLSVIVYGLFTLYNGYEYIINPTKTLLDCHK
jgi:sulfite exporter TauE/SafE